MAKYRTEKDGSQMTIWNDTEGVGLRFMEGETLQRYEASLIVTDPSRLGTEKGVADVTRVKDEITRYAEEAYPKEFAPLAD